MQPGRNLTDEEAPGKPTPVNISLGVPPRNLWVLVGSFPAIKTVTAITGAGISRSSGAVGRPIRGQNDKNTSGDVGRDVGFWTASAAGMVSFSFSGLGFSGSGTFTVVPNVSPPDPNPLCATAGNCRADPPGAYRITDISGTFSDANIGLTASITGLVPTHPSNERDPTFDPLVPPASASSITPTKRPATLFPITTCFSPLALRSTVPTRSTERSWTSSARPSRSPGAIRSISGVTATRGPAGRSLTASA